MRGLCSHITTVLVTCGLRDYGTASWDGGDPECDHLAGALCSDKSTLAGFTSENIKLRTNGMPFKDVCRKCGAIRVDQQLGMEPTPEEYTARMVAVFAEVRRVLKPDGVLWLNLGSSYSSGIIESHEYIIRTDITDAEYAQAMSAVWSFYGSAEFHVPSMLPAGTREAGVLHRQEMQEMRQDFQDSPFPGRTGAGGVLQQVVREIGESDAKEVIADGFVPDLRQDFQQIRCGDQEESGEEPLLQPGVLVQLQPEGQSLPLGRWSARTDEPGRHQVAEVGSGQGSVALPSLPCAEETRSAPHSPVRQVPGEAMGCGERDHALPRMSRSIQEPRDGTCGYPDIRGVSPVGRLALKVPKHQIPEGVLHLFRPCNHYKPKDLINIPCLVAEALRHDGWYLRSDIMWSKPNPMPESVTDRPTKSHEHIFLLSKSARYHYDAAAIAEPLIYPNETRRPLGSKGAWQLDGRKQRENGGGAPYDGYPSARNARDVWTIPTQPYSGAHFATFPPELPRRCILAGCPPGGVVLDPFFGSGTTGMVAESLARKWIGIELNPQYIELARKRTAQRGFTFDFTQI